MRTEQVKPICGKIDHLLRHIMHCPHLASDTELVVRARKEYERRNPKKSNKENTPASSFIYTPQMATLSQATLVSSIPPGPSTPGQQTPMRPAISDPSLAAQFLDVNMTPTVDPFGHPAKRLRYAPPDAFEAFYGETVPVAQWSDDLQEQFSADLCRMFIACNIAWSAVENPHFRAFFARWMSQAILPGRKTLSGRILDALADEAENEMTDRVRGRYATGQCDGWKNITKDSLIASMINVEYTVCLLF